MLVIVRLLITDLKKKKKKKKKKNSIRNELNPNVIKRVTNISLDKKEDEHNKWKK